MIATVLIVAGVCGLGLSYLGVVHHFWLGKSLNEETSLDPHADGKKRNVKRC